MVGVKVTFKIGNRRGVLENDVDAQGAFVSAMGEETVRRAETNFEVDVPRLQRVLDTRISNSLRMAVNFAAMNMMGVKSNVSQLGRAAPTSILFNMGEDRGFQGEGDRPIFNPSQGLRETFGDQGFELQWAALSRRTIMKKSGSANSQARERAKKFFIDKGDLQKDLRALANDVVHRTGTVKIYYAKGATTKTLRIMTNQRRVRVGQLRLTFLPKIPIRNLKGFLTEDPTYSDGSISFEKSLGLSIRSLKKLQGIEGYHRPLLQPVFSYWMLTRIPRLVGAAINNAIRMR